MKKDIPVYATIAQNGCGFSVNFHHKIGSNGGGGQNGCISGYSLDTILENSRADTPLIDWRPADSAAITKAILMGRKALDKGIKECAPDNPFTLADLLTEARELGAAIATVGDYITSDRLDCRTYYNLQSQKVS